MRSISRSALVHDSSYNTCIVIKGERAFVSRVLSNVILESKALKRKNFTSGKSACAVHLLSAHGKRRIICPAMVYHVSIEKDAQTVQTHVWVHPRGGEKALEAFRATVSHVTQGGASTRYFEKNITIEMLDTFARFEIIGAKAFEVVQRLVPSIDLYATRHVARDIRHFVAHDPRMAAWGVKIDETTAQPPSENAPTQAECDEIRKASREAMLELPWEGTKIVGVKTYSAMMINRGATALEGYTLIVPGSWALPLWLGISHTGARATGLMEWAWCAQRFKRAVYPNDYLDTEAGREHRQQIFSDILELRQKIPHGKISQCVKVLETCTRHVPVQRVLRVDDARLQLGTFPKQTMVRITLRCPWIGQPTIGSTVLMPTEAQRNAWWVKKNNATTRHRDELCSSRGEIIGYVTSVSAPPASVGLASALIDANSLKTLANGFRRGKSKVFVMLHPPGKFLVPAEADIVVKSSSFDEPWF